MEIYVPESTKHSDAVLMNAAICFALVPQPPVHYLFLPANEKNHYI